MTLPVDGAARPTTKTGRELFDAVDSLGPAILAIEVEAAADEHRRIRGYCTHTRDMHGNPCPEDVRPSERADGIHCICGLDQPKRYMDAGWKEKYGRG